MDVAISWLILEERVIALGDVVIGVKISNENLLVSLKKTTKLDIDYFFYPFI